MLLHQGQHHVIWMAALCSLGHDNENEVQHNYFGHVTPLATALASCDADSVVNGTNAFLSYRQLK